MLKDAFCYLALPVVLLPGVAGGADRNVEVTALPMKAAEERLFDPRKPPGAKADAGKPGDLPGPPVDEGGKPLIGPEDACAVYEVLVEDSSFDFQGDWRIRVTITSAKVTLAGTVVIYLPKNAPRRLVEHERGHDVLARFAYERTAEAELNKALRGFVGRSYLPRPGKSAKRVAEEVFYRRITKAGAATQAGMDAISDEYDRLTEHARSRRVDTKTGIERAKQWFEKWPPEGEPRHGPVPQKAR